MVNKQATNCPIISLQQRVLTGALLTRNLKPALNCTELSDPLPPETRQDKWSGRSQPQRPTTLAGRLARPCPCSGEPCLPRASPVIAHQSVPAVRAIYTGSELNGWRNPSLVAAAVDRSRVQVCVGLVRVRVRVRVRVVSQPMEWRRSFIASGPSLIFFIFLFLPFFKRFL
jgi:hypothetical protein